MSSNPKPNPNVGRAISKAANSPWIFFWIFSGTILCIAIVVFFTPMDPIPTNQKIPSVETKNPAAFSPASLESIRRELFPNSDQSTSVEQLQSELASTAELLMSQFPRSPEAYHVAAMIFSELKQSQNAESAWRKCIEFRPTESGPYVGLASLLMDKGGDEEAISLLEQLRGSNVGTGEVFSELARGLINLGELAKAKLILDNGIREFPKEAGLWRNKGILEAQVREYENAELSLKRSIELGDRTNSTVNALVTVLIRNQKAEEANRIRQDNLVEKEVSESEKSDTFQIDYEKALRKIAVRLLRLSSAVAIKEIKFELAEGFLTRAISLIPDELECYMDLSSLFRKTKRLDKAIACQVELLDRQPENVLNYINLASVASQAGDFEFAYRTLERATKRFPDVPYPLGELARLALAKRDFDGARGWLAKAISLEPNNVEWYFMSAMVAREKGNKEEFSSMINQASKLAPSDPRLNQYRDPASNL
jgi:tetratricopeptide (TPR) repeat protein